MTTTNFYYRDNAVIAYPDGWSCEECGTEFTKKTINVECYYVICNKDGTICLECYNEK
jgi:hypothetical protein